MTYNSIRFGLISVVAVAMVVVAAVPEFTVNLDEAPEDRWREVTMYYLNSGMIHSMKANMESKLAGHKLTEEQHNLVLEWTELAMNNAPDEYKREAEGIAKIQNEFDPWLNSTALDIIGGALGYEANYPTFCSGLLTATSNGTVIHTRNLDYPLSFMHQGRMIGWQELTVNVVFTRGGKPLYTSVTWPGMLGIHTAMRFDGWAFQQNTRRTGNDMQLDLAAGQKGALGFTFFARQLMEEVADFEIAVQRLKEANFMAAHYFILSGNKPWQGAVLSIDRMALSNPKVVRLNQNNWHIIQTNDDQDGPAYDSRRPWEENRLKTLTQDIVSPSWAFNEMRQEPLFNKGTVFTWIAIPSINRYELVMAKERVPDSLALPLVKQQSASFLGKIARH